jgi:hypothetical protein
MVKRHGSNDDKFVYKGRVDLIETDGHPATEEERDSWTSEIRGVRYCSTTTYMIPI